VRLKPKWIVFWVRADDGVGLHYQNSLFPPFFGCFAGFCYFCQEQSVYSSMEDTDLLWHYLHEEEEVSI
jgi:hypothetical protein